MSKNILIVDDEKIMVDFLAGCLKIKGYDVLKAFDSRGATEIIRQGSSIDLVLLDMRLLGSDGLEILKILRRDYPKVQVIVITGYNSDYRQKVLEVGCEAFFSKPILIEELQDKIDELLSAHPSPSNNVAGINKDKLLPKARLFLIEPRQNINKLLLDYLSHKCYCQGEYQVRTIDLGQDNDIRHFAPQLVLFDIVLVKKFGEFSSDLMKFGDSLKEIITFGEPVAEWDELDTLLERNIIDCAKFLDTQSAPRYRSLLNRLENTLTPVCLKYGLYADNS